MNLLMLKTLFIAIYFVHTLIIFKVMEQSMSLKGGNSAKLLACAINTIFHMYLLETVSLSGYMPFVMLLILYVVEVAIIFDATILQKMAFALMPTIHLMAGSFLVSYMYATYMRFDFVKAEVGIEFLISIRLVVCLIICLCVLTVLKVGKKKHWDILRICPKRLIALFILQVLQIIQLFVTCIAFYKDIYSQSATKAMLISGVANLVIFYLALFTMVGIEIVKDRKVRLKTKELEEMYKDILTYKADHTMEIEVNVTTGIITSYLFCGKFQPDVVGVPYDRFIRDVVYTRIHPDDRKEVLNTAIHAENY